VPKKERLLEEMLAMNEALILGSLRQHELTAREVAQRRQLEAEQEKLGKRLRDQQFHTRSLIESNIDALTAIDPSGIIADVNKQMVTLTGCTREELIGSPFKSYFTDPELAQGAINRVLRDKRVNDYELTACCRDGKQMVVSLNAATLYNRDRSVQGVFVAARDITERKRVERNTALLLDELDHRVKNILAVVSAMVSQTSTTGLTTEAFAATIQGRVKAIAKAHNLLTQGGVKGEVSLRAIVMTELAPYEREEGQFVVTSGDVALPPKAGLSLAMAVHELTANAAKFGALSTSSGRLEVAWSIAYIASVRTLTLTWTEIGGPTVQPPTREGFGTTLIENALIYNLNAKVTREFLATGLRCTMVVPMQEAGRMEQVNELSG
jgi:two-component system CheB/CheR fusion protein